MNINKKIKISFIGTGFFSQISHIVNYYKNPKVELFEICEIDSELAKGVKKRFNFTGKIHNDYKKMNISKTDGFVIIVQRKLINAIAKYFIKKGCSVFTEKPHSYSFKDFKINKKNQKGVWLKGYTRRSDRTIRLCKKKMDYYLKNYGKLISVNFEAKDGNSYLGAKHFVKPQIKKVLKSKISTFPIFLKKRNYKLYDSHLNSACHSLDIFDFFNFRNCEIKNTKINEKEFLVNFDSDFKKQKKITCRIHLLSSKVRGWYEKMEFAFEKGQIIIKFNSPLYKKSSHILIEKNLKNKKNKKITFKKSWSFDEQTKHFVNLVKNFKRQRRQHQDSLDGEYCISFYEQIWKNSQKYQK